MENTFLLQGLHCPTCAAKIEHEISLLSGVVSSSINLMQQKLTISAERLNQNLVQEIVNIVHKHEPLVTIIPEETTLDPVSDYAFHLEGLHCPNCAAKITHDLEELSFIKKVELNLLTQSLVIRSNAESKKVQEHVAEIVAHYEPDVRISQVTAHVREHLTKEPGRLQFASLFLGALLFGLVLLLNGVHIISATFATPLFIFTYLLLGYKVLRKALHNICKGSLFDENFLMSIATGGALALGEYPEACAVMLFYELGEYLQAKAVGHSKKSIAALMNIRPEVAHVIRDGITTTVAPKDVQCNDLILVAPGEKIPLDGCIVAGESSLDTRALTGEALPKTVGPGDQVLSGCINETHALTVQVTKTYANSTVAQILKLVESASQAKSPTENFITVFARFYTPIVVALAVLLAFVPPICFHFPLAESIHRSLVFLIVSCPCALIISIPLTYFGGLGQASKCGVLIKGSNYLEALSKLECLVFDKTGTLTQGQFSITKLVPAQGVLDASLLHLAGLAEAQSKHPIAQSIVTAAKAKLIPSTSFEEIPGQGVIYINDKQTIVVGNSELMQAQHIAVQGKQSDGATKVYVACNGKYMGYIVLADQMRPGIVETMQDLRHLGVKQIALLTGDTPAQAAELAKQLGFNDWHANLLPAEKVEHVSHYKKTLNPGKKLAFVGDGINDAPVLARADVGIAMGGLGSDAAIEAADVVLMADEPAKIVSAIKIAKYTKQLVWQNIALALGIKFLFLLLGAWGLIGLWLAVFADVGVTLLAVANAMRILTFREPQMI